MRRLALALFLLAAPAAAQYPLAPRVYEAASLPTGTPYWREGTAFMVTDGSDDSDCSTGGGSSVHWCFSDGAGGWAVNDGAVDGSGSANQIAYWSDGDTLTSASSAVIEAGAGADTLVVDSASRVGIGTNAPASPLEVVSAATNSTVVKIEASDGSALANVIEDTNGHGDIQIKNASGVTKIRLDSATELVTAANVNEEGADFGSLYENTGSPGTEIDVATAGNYYGWVSATAGSLNGITADTADATADHLTIATAGDYYVSISLQFSGTAVAIIECALFVDGVENVQIEIYRKLGTAGDVGSASAAGTLSLSASDELSIRCTSDSNGDDVDVWAANLSVVGIG
jgi:hypothetical protein